MKWRVIQEVYGRRKTVAKDLTRAQAERIVHAWGEMDRLIKRKNVRYQIMGSATKNPHRSRLSEFLRRHPDLYEMMAEMTAPERREFLAQMTGPRQIRKSIRRQIRKRAKPPKKKNPAQYWYIHIQKHGRGPIMLWNGKSFASASNAPAFQFTSADAAMYKARHLLGKYHDKLRMYKIWVSDQFHGVATQNTRVNPSRRNLDEAAKKLEDFTGREATHVERVPARSNDKTGLVVGEIKSISYLAAREGIDDGRTAEYRHTFKKGSRPLLAASTDGKQLHVVGGQYEFTEAGIEDR